ncbi:MAG: DUF2914 domain-containing protein [Calditrichia bacterium]
MKGMVILGIVVLMAVGMVVAQEAPKMIVEEMKVCTAVTDREPVGVDSVFFNQVEQIYCFTKISGAADPVTVEHVWYYGEKEMARVPLEIKAESWRTWSSKRIVEGWVGDWRVDVVLPDGQVLASKSFVVKKMEQ